MTATRGLLILLAIVVGLIAILWIFACPTSEDVTPRPERIEPVTFDFDDLEITSPDLAVGPAAVRGAVHPDYLSWSVTVGCAEPGGCVGEFDIEISYDTGSGSRRIVVGGPAEAPEGGDLRFEGLQDPPTPVDRITGLRLEVVSRGPLGRSTDDEPEG